MGKEKAIVVLVSFLDAIWAARNAKIHEGKVDILRVVRKLGSRVDELLSKRNVFTKKHVEKTSGWARLENGWIVVNIDATAHNGRNALAMVARDENKTIIHLATN